MNRELLERPFAPAQIRQRKGRNGLLDYVEGHSVIQRLNDALESQWSFDIVHHEVREEEVLVIGRFSAGPVTKMAFGGSQVTRERETGKPVSLGDDLKAAATDALKKCATFLGVGLHLYAEKPIGGRAPAARGPAAPPRPTPPLAPGPGPQPPRPGLNSTRPAQGNGSGAGVRVPSPRPDDRGHPVGRDNGRSSGQGSAGAVRDGQTTGAATPRQIDAIWKVGRAKGLDPSAVEHMSLRVFNRRPDALTQQEAAGLLRELSNLKRRVA